MESLQDVAQRLVAPGRGVLAADESLKSAGKRLAAVGLPNTAELRRQYRELFLTTPGIGQYLSGVILFEETFSQAASDGVPFLTRLKQAGVMPGIKMDKGTAPLPNSPRELVTEGLADVARLLPAYKNRGAMFTKWRAVITIGRELPSEECLTENSQRLAQFAAESQAAGLVPIVEPEVLWEGDYTLEKCGHVTQETLGAVFQQLAVRRVDLTGLVLKCNMVLAGKHHPVQSTPQQAAEATLAVLTAVVPREVPGIVFLSGGQSAEQATANLQAIAQRKNDLPWQLTFSFARALQGSALEIWRGKPENMQKAQQEFLKRLKLVSLAREGQYDPGMEQSGNREFA